MKKYNKALEDITVALRIEPNNAGILESRSNVYRELGRYKEAIADINKAISIEPDFSVAYYTRGLNYRAMGETEKAQADFKKACDMGEKEACEALEEMGE
jgi:tetratricopeptide (TPR) repeat protein